MAKTKSVFEEALDDAKKIRQTAIINAKQALEESITPKLQQMISTKLQEMEEDQLDESEEIDESFEMVNEEETEETETEETETEETEEAVDAKISSLTISELTQLIKTAVAEEMGSSTSSEETDIVDDTIEMDDEVVDNSEMGDGFEDETSEETEMVGDDDEIDLDELMQNLDELNENEEELDEAKVKGTKMQQGSTPKSPTGFKSGNLKEAKMAAKLKQELNEINLLNAKLLYVNKIFTNNSLKEAQKMNVLNKFENLKSVREVKLVYESLKDSFKNVNSFSRKSLKENLGFASKPTNSMINKNSNSIVNDSAINRMKTLAGIK